MAELKEEHFETIDKNKAKAYEEQKSMRQECKEYIETCGTFHLQEIHSEIKRMKRNKI
jgi:hypothetical protein|tara:strand:+ start:116 stop:289 length:174 start_codon:yes stop_codon:yes gene_type:complete